MANPARELVDLLVSWQPDKDSRQTIQSLRAVAAGLAPRSVSIEFWRHITRAVELVVQYETALDGLELQGRDVSHYREYVPRIYDAIYAPGYAWNDQQAAARAVTPREVLNSLRGAGDAIEGFSGAVGLTPDRLDDIVSGLKDIRDDLGDLPESRARDHLGWLVDQAIRYGEDIGSYGIKAFTESTVAVVNLTAEVARESPTSEAMRRHIGDIIKNLIASGLWVEGPAAIEAAVKIIHAIGGS